MEVGGQVMESERLGRPKLKGEKIYVEVIIRGKPYVSMLERILENKIEGSTIVEGG